MFKYIVCMYVYLCTYVSICGCIPMCVYIYVRVWVHMRWVMCCSISDLLVRSEPGNKRLGPDLKFSSLRTEYTGDSKNNLWDDPKIPTGSCSEDQTTIQFQNCVILFECLLLYYFLIYRCHWIFICYLYHFIWPPDIFYQYDYLYHFMWCR